MRFLNSRPFLMWAHFPPSHIQRVGLTYLRFLQNLALDTISIVPSKTFDAQKDQIALSAKLAEVVGAYKKLSVSGAWGDASYVMRGLLMFTVVLRCFDGVGWICRGYAEYVAVLVARFLHASVFAPNFNHRPTRACKVHIPTDRLRWSVSYQKPYRFRSFKLRVQWAHDKCENVGNEEDVKLQMLPSQVT